MILRSLATTMSLKSARAKEQVEAKTCPPLPLTTTQELASCGRSQLQCFQHQIHPRRQSQQPK